MIGDPDPYTATINALEQLRDRKAVMEMRGLTPEKS